MGHNSKFLISTSYLDFESEEIEDYLKDFVECDNTKETAIKLYLKVRDDFIYDPYKLDLTEKGLKASSVVTKKRAWCVEKACLLAACARSFGIPSRVGYANVKNHIGVERLTQILKSETIVCHGYTDLFIDGKWVKATPAFDKRICKLTGVEPLEFNGEDDSLFQEFSGGNKFMEYLEEHGVFEDVPQKFIQKEMKKYYPHLFKKNIITKEFVFLFE